MERKRCRGCHYRMGVTETRCDHCGSKLRRARAGSVSLVSLVLGLLGGWCVNHFATASTAETRRYVEVQMRAVDRLNDVAERQRHS